MTMDVMDNFITRLSSQRDLMQAVNAEMVSTCARVASADHAVIVEVDGLGAMTELQLGKAAYRHGPDALAGLILETAHAAAQMVFDRQNHLIAQFNMRLNMLQKTPTTDA